MQQLNEEVSQKSMKTKAVIVRRNLRKKINKCREGYTGGEYIRRGSIVHSPSP